MGKIVALGGGVFMGKNEDRMPPSMRPIHERIIGLTGKKHPRVLYIPTAANDSEDRIRVFKRYYKKLGCRRVEALRLLKNPPSHEEIKQKIQEADAIFVTGGNTYRMIATWKRLGVDKLLKEAHEKGTVMSGFSAGSICWFKYGNSDSFSKKKIFRVAGMGIFNALLCPHYDSEPHRQPALKKMMKRTRGMAAIALDEYASIEIIDGKYRFMAARPAAKARRIYWKGGDYIVEEQKMSDEFGDFEELLNPPDLSTPRRRAFGSKRLAYLLIVLGIIAGAVALAILHGQTAKPQPPSLSRPAPSSTKPDQHTIDTYDVLPDAPRYITIPAANVPKSRVIQLGLTKNGQIAVPGNIYDAGWYGASAKPGQAGAMFVYGHVSSWQADGLFHDLNKLRPGDKITVTRGDDKTFTYQVVSKKTYPKDAVDMKAVLAPVDADKQGLNLMTCTGHVIKGTSDFSDRLVVFARST